MINETFHIVIITITLKLKYCSRFMIFYVITMYFAGGLIPTYLIVSKLHMINSIWALILPGGVAVYYVIISRTFFANSIPESLYDAAAIDGSTNMRTFYKIILPLSKPLIAVMAIYAMVNYWNDWFTALIYLPTSSKTPLQLVLRQILIKTQEAKLGERLKTEILQYEEGSFVNGS